MKRIIRSGLVAGGAMALVLTATTAAQASVSSSTGPCAQPNGRVSASTVSSGVLYVGGAFTSVTDRSGHAQPRAHLAAIDMATCDVLPWTADANGNVLALTNVGGAVYAGGSFTSVEGQSRPRLAAIDALTGLVLPFAPTVNNTVNTLATNGTTLYAGGAFTTVNGSKRTKLAAFDVASGTLSATWKPIASAAVTTLSASPNGARIYVGGSFLKLNNNASYPYIGSLDATTGAIDPTFTPSFGGGAAFPIVSMVADDRGVYAGGNGQGGQLVIWNLDGSLQQPVYQTDGGVQAVAVSGDSLYAGGHFDNYCVGNTGSGKPYLCDRNLARKKLFEVTLSTGALTSWAPVLNSAHGVFTEALDPATGSLYIGGDFTTINTVRQARLGVFAAV
jgi:hypothetical protein